MHQLHQQRSHRTGERTWSRWPIGRGRRANQLAIAAKRILGGRGPEFQVSAHSAFHYMQIVAPPHQTARSRQLTHSLTHSLTHLSIDMNVYL